MKIQIVRLLAIISAFVLSSCGSSISSKFESGKARVARSENVPVVTDQPFKKILPLSGGSFIFGGASEKCDSIKLLSYDDSLHQIWSMEIAANMAGKGSWGIVPHEYHADPEKMNISNGDMPDWSSFYVSGTTCILPINTTRDSQTTYHALMIGAMDGAPHGDITLGQMRYDERSAMNAATEGDGAAYRKQEDTYSNFLFHLRFSPDSSKVLVYHYHQDHSQVAFNAQVFDNGLQPIRKAQWNIALDSAGEKLDGVLVDNSGVIYTFIRSYGKDNSWLRVVRQIADGSSAELRLDSNFGERTNLSLARIAVGTGGKAYYACGLDRKKDLSAAVIGLFNFDQKKSSLHSQDFSKNLLDSLCNFDKPELGNLFISPKENTMILSFQEWDEESILPGQYKEFKHQYVGPTGKFYPKDVLVIAFDLDGNMRWSNGIIKNQEDKNYSYLMASASDHSVDYLYVEDRYLRRARFDITTGKNVSPEDDRHLLRLGGFHNWDARTSLKLADGSYLMYSESNSSPNALFAALGGNKADAVIFKVVE